MHHSTSDVLGQAAYLKRSCEILLEQLTMIDPLVTGTERLTPMQEAEIAKATERWAAGARDHVDLASQYIRDWHQALVVALSMEPNHLQ